MHLSDATPKNGIIDCSMCEKRFFIKDFIAEFTTNEQVKCIMEADAILSSGERKSKANILDLLEQQRELHEKLISEQNAFEALSFDHFQEVCRLIELQREELKRTIDQIADEMIKKSKEKQAFFQRQHNQLATVAPPPFKLEEQRRILKDHFRRIELTSETTQQLEDEHKQQINKIQLKLVQFNQMREQVSSCTFEPNLDFDQDNFGSLWLRGSNQLIATCSEDLTIKLWEIESGNCLKTLDGHVSELNIIIKLPRNQLASGSEAGTVKIWNLCSGKCVRTLIIGGPIMSLQLLSEQTIAIGILRGDIRIWNFNNGTHLSTLVGNNGWTESLALLKSQVLASRSNNKNIKLWNLNDGACVFAL
jgi:WD40 repeat protein